MRAVLVGFILLLASCSPRTDEIVVYASVDEVYARPLFEEFTRRSGVRVLPVFDTEEAKTLGLVHRLLAEKAHPQCDVFWAGDCVRTALLKREGVLQPFQPKAGADIAAPWRDPDHAWTGFGARARVIVYNTTSVKEPPRTLSALADPKWRGRVAIANPLFGTTANHFAALGETEALRLAAALKANGVRVVGGNSHVRDLVASGDCDVGLTDSDDVWIGKDRGDAIGLVYPDQEGAGTLAIPNSVALVRGAPHEENARRFIEHLLSPETERFLAASPSRQLPVRPSVSVELSKIRTMAVDWGTLSDSEGLLDRVKRALGL
ncbi:MAG TPA: extracellular solute-binding protein [Planctomycetota bacterium]|nr:extracellular solute-binding protein [Planctomycetota bacterium]